MSYRPDLDGTGQGWPMSALSVGQWCFRDGMLVARLPSGDLAYFDERWSVTGPPESPTARPSIRKLDAQQRTLWHGFLTEGRWEPCADSPDVSRTPDE